MSEDVLAPDVPFKVSHVCVSGRNDWWAIGTARGWFEFRITPTGLIRVGEFQRGTHPYFTKEDPR